MSISAHTLRAWLPPRGEVFSFLGLGSNLGDRMEHLQQGVDRLDADSRSRVDDVSSVYETEPIGGPQQEPYLNLAVRLATRRAPRSLLQLCHAAEAESGRVRSEHWGPRTLDVDILLYGGRIVHTKRLHVPHAELFRRAFALVPLIEVAPGMRLPDGSALTAKLAALAPIEGINPVGRQVGVTEGRV